MDVLQRMIDDAQHVAAALRGWQAADEAEIWEQVIVDLEQAKRRLSGASWFPWELPK